MTTRYSIKTVLRFIAKICFGDFGSVTVAALVVLAYPPIVLSAEPEIGYITAARGTVAMKRPGADSNLAVKQGLAFKVGDVIQTDANSTAQMTLTDDSFVNLGRGTSVRVNQYSFDPASDRRTAIIRVIEGKTRFIIYKLRSRDSSFRIDTGNALIVPGGFADLVVLASPGRTEVVVMDHGLNIRNSLPYVIGNVKVGVNQKTIINEKEPPMVPVVISPRERKEWLKDVKQK